MLVAVVVSFLYSSPGSLSVPMKPLWLKNHGKCEIYLFNFNILVKIMKKINEKMVLFQARIFNFNVSIVPKT